MAGVSVVEHERGRGVGGRARHQHAHARARKEPLGYLCDPESNMNKSYLANHPVVASKINKSGHLAASRRVCALLRAYGPIDLLIFTGPTEAARADARVSVARKSACQSILCKI